MKNNCPEIQLTEKQQNVRESIFVVRHESEDFSVCSDAIFLYEVGKICIMNDRIAEGINSLKDYVTLLTSLKSNSPKAEENELKAYYYIGLGLLKSQEKG